MAPSRKSTWSTGAALVLGSLMFYFLTSLVGSGAHSKSSALSKASLPNTDAVLYVHYDGSATGRRNLQFFIDHALHSNADFYFIINGYNVTAMIPEASNIHVIKRENACFDLGSIGEVVQANDGDMMKKYKRFICLNSSIRGPFFPNYARLAKQACWTQKLFELLSDTTKLVELTANCGDPDYGPKHLQSFALATDQIGFASPTKWTPSSTERLRSHRVFEMQDMTLFPCILPMQMAVAPANQTLSSGRAYFGMDVHPFDTIFTKVWRGDRGTAPLSPLGMKALDQLTKWTDESSFSSYDQC
ncbi:hypothetical protein BCR37DRAFT_385635 [Protomyces lactucae-debilis]|uniref:Uncharacterized protein n=1 Tax=Protomyces lactucae-debilis TaxID=2754530 RepID=A0A1Y2FQ82_PROLT|nr:uncharacterized protein BCR37DRAFT_385635 [Protomyces lactucae-debilis]ORY86153.1 hypothetical protein BCR37DRAFT_385635 [Protomyces lactucae-debilis]